MKRRDFLKGALAAPALLAIPATAGVPIPGSDGERVYEIEQISLPGPAAGGYYEDQLPNQDCLRTEWFRETDDTAVCVQSVQYGPGTPMQFGTLNPPFMSRIDQVHARHSLWVATWQHEHGRIITRSINTDERLETVWVEVPGCRTLRTVTIRNDCEIVADRHQFTNIRSAGRHHDYLARKLGIGAPSFVLEFG